MTPSGSRLAGTTAVITGGASGIGLATACSFASAGAHVVLCDLDEAALDAAEVTLGDSATAVCGDVASWEDCQRVAERAADVGRPVRSLVTCAATFVTRGEDATAEDWDASLGVNVKGAALMASAVVPLLRAAGQAAIVNVASISAYIAQPHRWAYNSSKGAILALTRCQALDLAPSDIRVNSVSPGTIWTPAVARIHGGDRALAEPRLARQHILGRVGEPAEVASAILFLCDSGASFITGTDLRVDGGYTAMGHDHAKRSD